MIQKNLITSVIAIGNPIVDIVAEIEKESVLKFGLEWGRTVRADEKNIGLFEELEQKKEVSYTPGGSIQNTLRVISWCLNMDKNNKGKYKVTMVGCVGEDEYKKRIMNSLKESGVVPLFQTVKEKTSRCGVGVYLKERCLVTEGLASKELSDDFVLNNKDEILQHKALIIEGYMLKSKMNICRKLCEEFKKENKLIIFTLGAVFIPQYFYENAMEIANMADIIIGNREEIEEFSKEKGISVEETFNSIHKKLTPRKRLLIATDGKEGAFFSEYNYSEKQVDCFVHCRPKKIKEEEIKDFNGAGDAFFGGFLTKYFQGDDLIKCCKFGNIIAGVIIRNIGCTFPKDYKIEY